MSVHENGTVPGGRAALPSGRGSLSPSASVGSGKDWGSSPGCSVLGKGHGWTPGCPHTDPALMQGEERADSVPTAFCTSSFLRAPVLGVLPWAVGSALHGAAGSPVGTSTHGLLSGSGWEDGAAGLRSSVLLPPPPPAHGRGAAVPRSHAAASQRCRRGPLPPPPHRAHF